MTKEDIQSKSNKDVWGAGTLLNPLPCVLVSCIDNKGEINVMTAAWSGVICSEPAMVYVSIRPERYSHHMIMETKQFVINLTTRDLVRATDYCGVRSGAKEDKWKVCGLTPQQASKIDAPLIAESPVNIECEVTQVVSLGSHDMFMAKIVAVDVDKKYIDEKGKFHLDQCQLIAYSHGEYVPLGKALGRFGYTVRKKKKRKK